MKHQKHDLTLDRQQIDEPVSSRGSEEQIDSGLSIADFNVFLCGTRGDVKTWRCYNENRGISLVDLFEVKKSIGVLSKSKLYKLHVWDNEMVNNNMEYLLAAINSYVSRKLTIQDIRDGNNKGLAHMRLIQSRMYYAIKHLGKQSRILDYANYFIGDGDKVGKCLICNMCEGYSEHRIIIGGKSFVVRLTMPDYHDRSSNIVKNGICLDVDGGNFLTMWFEDHASVDLVSRIIDNYDNFRFEGMHGYYHLEPSYGHAHVNLISEKVCNVQGTSLEGHYITAHDQYALFNLEKIRLESQRLVELGQVYDIVIPRADDVPMPIGKFYKMCSTLGRGALIARAFICICYTIPGLPEWYNQHVLNISRYCQYLDLNIKTKIVNAYLSGRIPVGRLFSPELCEGKLDYISVIEFKAIFEGKESTFYYNIKNLVTMSETRKRNERDEP